MGRLRHLIIRHWRRLALLLFSLRRGHPSPPPQSYLPPREETYEEWLDRVTW